MFCLPGVKLDTFKIRKILSESTAHTFNQHLPTSSYGRVLGMRWKHSSHLPNHMTIKNKL